jgi:hypothetical protein
VNVKWGLWERGQISGRDEADKRGYWEMKRFEAYYIYIYMKIA